jgi:hypothetical protein
LSLSYTKIWVRDPDSEKTYSGSRVKKAPDPGSGSATLSKQNATQRTLLGTIGDKSIKTLSIDDTASVVFIIEVYNQSQEASFVIEIIDDRS